MQEAGVNLVSVAIFAWSKLEPEEGRYEFGWLDRLLDLLHEYGVGACLATATAAPPPWLALKYPRSLPVTSEGGALWASARGNSTAPRAPTTDASPPGSCGEIATRYKKTTRRSSSGTSTTSTAATC
jgi:beta-galactosidase